MSLQGLQKTTHAIGGFLTKNSPTILTGVSVAGVITTAVMTGKASIKANKIVEAECERCPEPMTKKEILNLTWKCYIPAAIMGVATVSCIIGANSINLKRNAALAGAYSLADKALKEYQSKVIDRMGKDRHKEIKEQINQEKIVRNPVSKNEVILTGDGDSLCYDAYSGRYFKSDRESIRRALNTMSNRLMNEMFLTLNEVYSELDLPTIKLGDMVGWHIDQGLIEPEFGSAIAEDGRPCLVLDFDVMPRYCDREY